MKTIKVNPDMIRWARMRAELDYDDFPKNLPDIEAWEDGEKRPTLVQLRNFANKCMTPVGYLFLQSPPVEESQIADFRTIGGSNPSYSAGLNKTIQIMQCRQAWMREVLVQDGAEPLNFVGQLSAEAEIESAADEVKRLLNLPDRWRSLCKTPYEFLAFLAESLEKIGLLVMRNSVVGNSNSQQLSLDEFRGFVLVDEFAPLIFINNKDSDTAKVFTIIHEFVHVLIGEEGVSAPTFDLGKSKKSKIERFCNQVAGEFLVPESILKTHLSADPSSGDIYNLAAKLNISPAAVAVKAVDMKIISRAEFEAHLKRFEFKDKKGPSKSKGGPPFQVLLKSRLGERFSNAVVYAAKSGSLLQAEAHSLTGTTAKSFDSFTSHILAG